MGAAPRLCLVPLLDARPLWAHVRKHHLARRLGHVNVTAALTQAGVWNNALVLVFSDDGGDAGWLNTATTTCGGMASNHPLLGRKDETWEGGSRVTTLVSGGLIPPRLHGTSNDQLMHLVDWYATFSSLAGVDSPTRTSIPSLG